MFRRSISAMMADILCIERMCYLAVPNCRAIFLSSPTIHKKLVTPRERRISSQPWHTPGKKWFSPPVKLFICFLGFQFVSSSCLIQSCYHCRAEGCMLRHVSYVWGFSEWLLLVESASLHIHTSRIYHDAIVNVCLNKLSPPERFTGMDK